jgi:hypothetical protein
MFGNPPMPGNHQIYPKLITGTEYGAVVVRVGDFIQDHNQPLLLFPEMSDEGLQGDFRILPEVLNLQDDAPVLRSEPIQFMSTYPVDRNLMFSRKAHTFLSPRACFRDQERPYGFS